MAVLDQYTDSKIGGNVVNKLLTAVASAAGELVVAVATFEVAAADDNGSVYRIFKSVDSNLIPIAILIGNDALTSGSDWDVGLYKPDLQAVVSANVFADALDLSTAHTLSHLVALSGLKDVDVANITKRLYEHAGHTILTRLEAYDIALTANTVGSAAGTVSVIALFAQG